MSQKPISDLRRRMLEDMAVRRFSEKTKHDYIRHIEAFTRFLGRSPDTATAEDLRRFQVHEMEQGAKAPKMNTQVSALRFFLKTTLGRHGPASEARLTSGCEQVQQLAGSNARFRTLATTPLQDLVFAR